MESYTTVKMPALGEYEEKRSRFIGCIMPVSSEAEAIEAINKIKKLHYDAKHNCSAYILKNGTEKYSDDGEPQGTAGKPILEVIRKNGLSDVLIVVTRYFGGILLGAGGLTRAYSHCAAEAVSSAELTKMIPYYLCELECEYSDFKGVKRLIENTDGKDTECNYAEKILISFSIPTAVSDIFSQKLTELSSGRLTVSVKSEIFGSEK